MRFPRLRALGALLLAIAMPSPGTPAGVPSPPAARFAFRSYGSALGLGSLAVHHLLQDRMGYLWVGTEDGLYRYDGSRFQRFSLQEGLPSSFITDLLEDRAGRLWVGTFAGLAWKDGAGFRATGPDALVGQVRAVVQDSAGNLWVATPGGLFRRTPGGGFQVAPGWKAGAPTTLTPGLGDPILWAAAEGAIWALGADGAWSRRVTAPGAAPTEALREDHHRVLWIRSHRGLWALGPDREGLRDFTSAVPPPGATARLTLDRRGQLWVPHSRGISSFDGIRWQHLDRARGLPTSWVRNFLEDREGNLWFASLGVHRQLGRGEWEGLTVTEGLPSDVIRGVWRDRDGTLLVGSDLGLCRWNGRTWTVLPGTQGRSIRGIAFAPGGSRFLLANPAALLRWPRGGARAEGLPLPFDSLGTKRLFALLRDQDGSLLVATENAGLVRVFQEGAAWRILPLDLPGSQPGERFSDLVQDPGGRLWAAGSQGLACREQGRWYRFTETDGLRRRHVTYLAALKGGDLLAAYFDPLGVARLRPGGAGRIQVVEHLDSQGGLSADKAYFVQEDAAGRLWVGSGRGIDLLGAGLPAGTVRRLGAEDGLLSEDCNAKAFLAEANGEVWVGTSSGLIHYCAAEDRGLPPPPTTALLWARLGEEAPLADGDRTRSELAAIPRSGAGFVARFSGLSYRNENRIQHQVRLLGLESEWHSTEAREARFPALGPGRYTFEVRSRYGEGSWGEPTTLTFRIRPTLLQTVWFRLLLLLLFAGMVGGAVRWRMNALRTQTLTDPLTGLRNRRFLDLYMGPEVSQVVRFHREKHSRREMDVVANQDMIFLMVDLDHFKAVNDTQGHHAGDRVLQQVAEILATASRGSDSIIRWGGEEFLLVARKANRTTAHVVAERIRSNVARHLFQIGNGRELHLTCSVGFASFPFQSISPDAFTWEQVVGIADQCLYAAKRGGRNAWVGLLATDSFAVASGTGNVTYNIPAWLEEGHVLLQSSLPNPEGLAWDLVGTL